ncbi:MAG: hypothetical protein JW959_10030 [Pirellulales bacterium]|nr:hypothetical protein [Pirellulales bacterium]
MKTNANNYRKGEDGSDVKAVVGRLAWATFDGCADQGDAKRLEELIVSNKEARRAYLECAEIESQLFSLFAKERKEINESQKKKKNAA